MHRKPRPRIPAHLLPPDLENAKVLIRHNFSIPRGAIVGQCIFLRRSADDLVRVRIRASNVFWAIDVSEVELARLRCMPGDAEHQFEIVFIRPPDEHENFALEGVQLTCNGSTFDLQRSFVFNEFDYFEQRLHLGWVPAGVPWREARGQGVLLTFFGCAYVSAGADGAHRLPARGDRLSKVEPLAPANAGRNYAFYFDSGVRLEVCAEAAQCNIGES